MDLEELRRQNRYCDCAELQDLNQLRKRLETLEARCDFFSRETPQTPKERDRKFLIDYSREAGEFQKLAEDYQELLEELIEEKRLYKKTSGENFRTVHCSRCDSQIEVIELEN